MTLATNGLQNAVAYRWTYPDAATRLAATGFGAADVGALALQLDTSALYLLTATTPVWMLSQGPAGPAGANGATGPAGQGVPVGGTTGQALVKTGSTDYATGWGTGASGAPSGAAGGDLGSTYPNPTVPGLATKEASLGNPATSGYVLSSTAAGARSWIAPGTGGGLTNPMTTAQDLIVGGASGTPTRFGVGGANQVLTVVNGVLTWAAPAAGGGALPAGGTTGQAVVKASAAVGDAAWGVVGDVRNPLTAQGDLLVGGAATTTNSLLATLGVTATESAAATGRAGAQLIDNNPATDFYTGGASPLPAFVRFDLGPTPATVVSGRIVQNANTIYRASDLLLQSSPDGTTWTTAYTGSGAFGDSGVFTVAPAVLARYWRITSGKADWALTSVELYSGLLAGNPARLGAGANGQVLTVVNGLLTWSTPATGAPAALTGATAATRYVGGTASGAPTTGTFAVGDFVIDQTAAIWVCTVAGTPGTWIAEAAPFVGTNVYSTVTQAIATGGGFQAITFNSVVEDRGGFYSAGANTRLTIPVGAAGRYIAYASHALDANATGNRQAEIRLNGVTQLGAQAVMNMDASASPQPIVLVPPRSYAAGDYLTTSLYQTSGVALNRLAGVAFAFALWRVPGA